MLSEQNHIIHSGNYEEFFLLYIDKELNDDEEKSVDEFLLAHPHLRSEFEMLMNTQLPLEKFSFDKNELLAHKMKMTSINEELLLYIDNELSFDKKHIVEMELASDKDYQLQHRVLLQTKSDPSEQIVYPDKKELYRHTKKIVAFKPWMRVAASIVIAMAGLLYFKNTSLERITPIIANKVNKANTQQPSNTKTVRDVILPKEEAAVDVVSARKKNHSLPSENKEKKNRILQKNNNEVALNATFEENILPVKKVAAVDFHNGNMLSINKPVVSVNHFDVTSSIINRTTEEPSIDKETSIASNNHKGSIRGFLRKATRMIEKRTGIDPANDNGELLIGAVAVSLK